MYTFKKIIYINCNIKYQKNLKIIISNNINNNHYLT